MWTTKPRLSFAETESRAISFHLILRRSVWKTSGMSEAHASLSFVGYLLATVESDGTEWISDTRGSTTRLSGERQKTKQPRQQAPAQIFCSNFFGLFDLVRINIAPSHMEDLQQAGFYAGTSLAAVEFSRSLSLSNIRSVLAASATSPP